MCFPDSEMYQQLDDEEDDGEYPQDMQVQAGLLLSTWSSGFHWRFKGLPVHAVTTVLMKWVIVQEQEEDEEEEDPDASYPDRPVRRYMIACLYSYLTQYLARRLLYLLANRLRHGES